MPSPPREGVWCLCVAVQALCQRALLVFYVNQGISAFSLSFTFLLLTQPPASGPLKDLNTLSTKVRLIKAMVFPVVMYGFESWTIKKTEHQRIDAFELWCWRRLLRDPWTARRSNQSILKEISPGCSLEGLMLRLKLQYFGHLM